VELRRLRITVVSSVQDILCCCIKPAPLTPATACAGTQICQAFVAAGAVEVKVGRPPVHAVEVEAHEAAAE